MCERERESEGEREKEMKLATSRKILDANPSEILYERMKGRNILVHLNENKIIFI